VKEKSKLGYFPQRGGSQGLQAPPEGTRLKFALELPAEILEKEK
jgi:hypothetical protein